MNTTVAILAAVAGGICVGAFVVAAVLWLIRGRIAKAIQNTEARSGARLYALETRLQAVERQLQRASEQLEKREKDAAREKKNLVAILKGLTVSSLRIDRRVKAIERKTP